MVDVSIQRTLLGETDVLAGGPIEGKSSVPGLSRPRATASSFGLWWAVCVVLGGAHAWAARHAMNADGLSYVDMASAAVSGGLRNLVNGCWSPAYPAFLSLALRTFRPSPDTEFPVLHLVNFFIFICVLLCFTFFLKAWLASQEAGEQSGYMIPFGFCVFLWFTTEFITLRMVTPDLCVAGIVFLAAGMCCRIVSPGSNWRHYVALGGVLGFGYYAKGAIFPLGLMLLAVLFVWPPSTYVSRRRVLLSCLVFLLVTAPLVALMSTRAGRLSIGETGRLVYAWWVNDLRPFVGWTGEDGGSYGRPEHPPRTLVAKPRTLEFASPLSGTYPLWYDPSYWYAGAKPRFKLAEQISALVESLRTYATVLAQMGALLAGALALRILAACQKVVSAPGHNFRWMLTWPIFACSMYAFVYVDRRYIGAFLVLFWLAIYLHLGWRVGPAARRFVMGTVILVLFASSIAHAWASGADALRKLQRAERPDYLQFADGLRATGVQPGDGVASVGSDVHSFDVYYVRAARARVIAQIIDSDEFWRLSAAERATVTDALANIGVKALVARDRPVQSVALGWQDVVVAGSPPLSILPLRR